MRNNVRLLLGLASCALALYIFVRLCFSMAIEVDSPADLEFGFTPWGLGFSLAGLIVLVALRRMVKPSGAHTTQNPESVATPRIGRRAERLLLALLLAAHAALAAAYSWDLPLFEGPDENTHFEYARYIAREGGFPSLTVLEPGVQPDVRIDQKIQPPGYYLLLAPLLSVTGATEWDLVDHIIVDADRDLEDWDASNFIHGPDELQPYRGQVRTLHLIRLSGIAFTLLALLGMRRALRQARFGRGTSLAMTATVAFLPQLLHLAGVISNDLPAIALGTWIVALGLRWARHRALSHRSSLVLGLLVGAAAVCKLSGFVFLPWLAVVALLLAVRRAPIRSVLGTAALAALGFLLASGWYWIHNLLEYGHPLQNWVYQNAEQVVTSGFDGWIQWSAVFPGTFLLTFFCDLGWGNAWPADAVLIALGAVLFFWLAPLASRNGFREGVLAPAARGARTAALLLLALAWAAQLKFNLEVFQPYGRHHFPFLAGYAVLGAAAMAAAAAWLSARSARLLRPQLMLPLLFLAFALHGWLGIVRVQFHPLNQADDPHTAILDELGSRTPTREIAILEPANGERRSDAPNLRWAAEPGALYSVELWRTGEFSGASYRDSTCVLSTWKNYRVKLTGGEYRLTPDQWAFLFPEGKEVLWRVRRLTPVRDPGLVASQPRCLIRVGVAARMVSIAPGWARNSVNATIFRQHAIVSHGERQYTAFYDPEGRVVLARRELGSTEWTLRRTELRGNVRDAHNGISLGIDGKGILHVAWDHHGHPLRYCRGASPGSLELREKESMLGRHEGAVTYPQFYRLPDGRLLFLYRDGSSGNGNLVLNRFDPAVGEWIRLHDVLLDGEGERNAYWQAAIDPAGGVHLSWVWRESGDVATNHDLGYARSDDSGETWRRSDRKPYHIPIAAADAEYARRIPQASTLINQTSMAADRSGRPYIATYWRPAGTEVPQFQVVWHDGEKWHTQIVGRRTRPFSLRGSGTKRIPISRPQIALQPCGGDGPPIVHLIFRDEERGSCVSVASCADLESGRWTLRDLTAQSVGMWEPSYDRILWQREQRLDLFVQKVGQGDGERLEELAPQMVSVLEWTPPKPERER